MMKWTIAIGSVLLLGCNSELPIVGKPSVKCLVPTYSAPPDKLPAVEGRHYAAMCTEHWAVRWAVESGESAGDIGDAITARCSTPYYVQAQTEWPKENWPGVALKELPAITAKWRAEAVSQVVHARVKGCSEILEVSEYQWTK